jgi:hypothetical protein
MSKRTNRMAWGLAVGLAVIVLAGSGALTSYLHVYWNPETWDAFFDAASKKTHQYRLSMLLIAVTGLSFLGIDLWRTVKSWSELPPAEQRRRQSGLIVVGAVLMIGLLVMTR